MIGERLRVVECMELASSSPRPLHRIATFSDHGEFNPHRRADGARWPHTLYKLQYIRTYIQDANSGVWKNAPGRATVAAEHLPEQM